jgi:hypothetical protein
MATRNYRLFGRVVERTRRSGVPGVTVEAWDRDTRYHDMLGSVVTDAAGAFSIAFNDDYFGDFAPDRSPDVFFKVLRDGKVLLTSFDKPMMNLRDGDTQVTLEIAEAQQPEPGKDRIKTRQMLKATRFFSQSDFKGVMKEQRDKGSMLGGFLATLGGKAFANFDLEPLRPSGTQTKQVVGQDTGSAMANLAAQQVRVTEVKTFDPKTDADSVQALTDFPLRVKAGDQVRLYEEQGTVRYYTIVKPVAAADVNATTVARIDKDVQALKVSTMDAAAVRADLETVKAANAQSNAQLEDSAAAIKAQVDEIARLKTELTAVQQAAADKDVQIQKLRTDLANTQAMQNDLSARFSPDKLAALERQVTLLNERIEITAPRPAPAPLPPSRTPTTRGAKGKRGKGR